MGSSVKLKIIIEGAAILFLLSYLFYESFLGVIFMLPLLYVFYVRRLQAEKDKKKWRLNLEFKDALNGMTAALGAGYSVENSIKEAVTDLKCIYKDTDMIVMEYQEMAKLLYVNATVEEVFFRFAKRADIEDVRNFAWILYTAKRTGGDILKITKNTSNIISERIEVGREIKTLIAAKQFEANIMNLVPVGIIIYLKVSCAGFLDGLYHNPMGIMVMTVVLLVYLATFALSKKIVDIRI